MPQERDCETNRHQALLAEHAIMGEKIRYATMDLYRTETIIPLAIAVFYAWVYADHQRAGAIPGWMYFLPVILSILGAFRQYFRYDYIRCAHEYVKLLERNLYPAVDDSALGWETHWKINAKRFHAQMRVIFWLLLLVGTAALAIQHLRR